MFSADLSWTDGQTEKVGQRRERRARERESSIISSNSSTRHGHRTKGSITQLPSFSSVKGSVRRPSTTTSHGHFHKPSLTLTDPGFPLKDPLRQPDIIYSAKLDTKLPSGGSLDPPPPFPTDIVSPLPIHPIRSHQFNDETSIPQSPHKAWSFANQTDAENLCQSYEQIKNEVLALRKPQHTIPHNGITFYEEDSVTSPVELDSEERGIQRRESMLTPHAVTNWEDTPQSKYQIPPPQFEPTLELPSIFHTTTLLDHDDDYDDEDTPPPVPPKSNEVVRFPIKSSQRETPQSKDIAQSQIEIRRILDSDSSQENDSIDERRSTLLIGGHFQRFVRRMESAGPKIILERLKEEWDMPGDRGMSDELQLEKHLWALTAIHLQCMDRFSRQNFHTAPDHPLPPTLKRRRKILELDGSIGEIYQLSAIYPNSRIYHFTNHPQGSSIPIPTQASQHPICPGSPSDSLISSPLSFTASGVVPLPYANSSMHHIRVTRIATLLPASQLPMLLSECYRVLKPGGVMELRLMDATPERKSMGPLLSNWLEDRLLISLEQDFRCQRPLLLVPRWVREAGFVSLPPKNETERKYAQNASGIVRCLRLPAATSDSHSGYRDLVAQVGVLVSRALWKNAWGHCVIDDPRERWWWDCPDILEECREWKTTWDVGTMVVMKEL